MNISLDKAWKMLGPRVAVLITTLNKDSEPNIAPYSYVGSISFDPPMVWVGFHNGQTRHTYENIQKTKEFVVNVISEDFLEPAAKCAEISDRTKRLEQVGLELVDSQVVKPPTVKAAKIVLECKYKQELEIGGSHTIVIGEVVSASAEKVNENSNPKHDELKTIVHGSGSDFYTVGNRVKIDWGK